MREEKKGELQKENGICLTAPNVLEKEMDFASKNRLAEKERKCQPVVG